MQNFSLKKSIEILEKTPSVLENLLTNLSDNWINQNEGENTWSPFDIVGHLLHGEKTDWITRTERIIKYGTEKAFDPFDRFAQLETSKGKTIKQLLNEFARLRKENLAVLSEMNIQEKDLEKKGIHPNFGEVTLKELLATWVVHDLGHISQVVRVMAKQYKEEIGPWKAFLPIVNM
ncbi:MAG: DinB family protein [Calditrichaeota bacterium]|nr:MAG: DinB family protein [Calditrichota bacterium]MBL1207651.1 DinB family protein [Calditrichota bacterium]NOG47484.1 DinB family protein [Calditrichota bacterium]